MESHTCTSIMLIPWCTNLFEITTRFYSREDGLISIRDRVMMGNIIDVSSNSFDNFVSLDVFYDAT